MSDYVIQKIQKSDLQAIVDFQREVKGLSDHSYRDIKTVEWMLRDPYDSQQYNGYIARSSTNEVLGMIGFTRNEYQFGDKVLVGVIPMSWLVAPADRGILGIRLLLTLLGQGDFLFAFGGTTMALKVYSAAKLNVIGKAQVFTKVFNLYKFNFFRGHFVRKEFFKSLLFLNVKCRCSMDSNMVMRPYDEEWYPSRNRYKEISIVPTNDRNRWILECPQVESFAFSLEYNGKVMGNCICYINTGEKNYKKGRVILLPFAGNDLDFYKQAAIFLERFLIGKGCCSISLISNHWALNQTLKSCGYRTSSLLKGYPLYIRIINQELNDSDFSNWYLSYYESNKGHLHF